MNVAVAATVSAEASVLLIAHLSAAPNVPRAHLQKRANLALRVKAVAANAKASEVNAVANAHRVNDAKPCLHKLKIRWPWTSLTTPWASALPVLKDANPAKVVAMVAVNAVKVVGKAEERVVAAPQTRLAQRSHLRLRRTTHPQSPPCKTCQRPRAPHLNAVNAARVTVTVVTVASAASHATKPPTARLQRLKPQQPLHPVNPLNPRHGLTLTGQLLRLLLVLYQTLKQVQLIRKPTHLQPHRQRQGRLQPLLWSPRHP